jgi:RNase P/RNase MRP subunit p29
MNIEEELVRSELIGLNAKVIGSSIEGKIVNETKSMLTIEHKGRKKQIIKNTKEFEIEFKGQKVIIKGKSLMGKPEERIKKTW